MKNPNPDIYSPNRDSLFFEVSECHLEASKNLKGKFNYQTIQHTASDHLTYKTYQLLRLTI